MSKEAMKLALAWAKASGEIVFAGGGMAAVEAMNTWVASAEKALAEQKSGIKQVIELYDSPEQPAQQEPVATLWQHGETGRTRITMPEDITDCDARWFKAADLYTSPPASKPLTQDMVESCPYHGETLRGAFFDGWIKAEAAHGIKENT